MNKDKLVVYHGKCLDGFTSAWVAYRVFGDSADYIGVNHRDFDKIIDIAVDKDIYFLDVCFPRKEMVKIKKVCKDMHVLDHHATAYEDSGKEPWFIYNEYKSGAKMTWDYFFGDTGTISPLVEYVSDYDIYTFKLEYTRLINLILTSFEQTFDNWTKINEELSTPETLFKYVDGAKWILKHRSSIVDSISKSCKIITIGGEELVVVNSPYEMANDVGEIVISTYNKPALMWYLAEDGIRASLRSKDELAPVAFLAKQNPYGQQGGGHRNAAGMLIESKYIQQFFSDLRDITMEGGNNT